MGPLAREFSTNPVTKRSSSHAIRIQETGGNQEQLRTFCATSSPWPRSRVRTAHSARTRDRGWIGVAGRKNTAGAARFRREMIYTKRASRERPRATLHCRGQVGPSARHTSTEAGEGWITESERDVSFAIVLSNGRRSDLAAGATGRSRWRRVHSQPARRSGPRTRNSRTA